MDVYSFLSKRWFDAECIRYCWCAPISKPCHEILVFDQANNEAAVSHVITKTCPYNEDPPYTPLVYSKTRVYRGTHYCLIFALKHRLWVFVRTASLRRF